MIDEQRALSAYTDVLAVEWDESTGMARIVTLRECYHAVPEDGLHQCPDREYNGVGVCKHALAVEATRGRFNLPTGWLVADDLDERDSDRLAPSCPHCGCEVSKATIDGRTAQHCHGSCGIVHVHG